MDQVINVLERAFMWIDVYVGSLVRNIYFYLTSLGIEHVVNALAMLLIGVFCLTSLINIVLTLFSIKCFGARQRHVLRATARSSYWLSMFLQALSWCLASSTSLLMLQRFDFSAAIVSGALAVVSLMLSAVTMIFRRGGKRTYIAKSLSRLGVSLAVMGLILAVFGWILF